jgi:hypothetical protein
VLALSCKSRTFRDLSSVLVVMVSPVVFPGWMKLICGMFFHTSISAQFGGISSICAGAVAGAERNEKR